VLYDRAVTITAYTAPGEILMINVSAGDWDHMDALEGHAVGIDLDADGNVLGIEVIERSKFDLAAVAERYGITELVPAIEAAIAVAKPGP
jgi:uncharacterized protein YuzE